MSASRPLVASWLGRVGYLAGWRLQDAVASRVRAGGEERVLFLEHDPVYTIGRRGTLDHLLVDTAELRALGASVYRVDRGGDITYHGPGQLVGYPIVRLGERADLVRYVRGLESALIDVLASYGIAGRSEQGKTGVWVDLRDGRPAKIAAIGVRVSRGVTTHGFALNVSTDLAAFGRMVPCGFMHEVASLERLGVRAETRDVAARVADALGRELALAVRWGAVAPARDEEIAAEAPVRAAEDLAREAVPA
ncbi:MAG TPA: lipoyl(octanoyl) transferase LipB [Candidatus Limnocylindria bacterium]|nr:lipoyl(octanoyl) transferase LipB [Candidatus Limnocylindria bacterium]